jgi:cell division protein FtsL
MATKKRKQTKKSNHKYKEIDVNRSNNIKKAIKYRAIIDQQNKKWTAIIMAVFFVFVGIFLTWLIMNEKLKNQYNKDQTQISSLYVEISDKNKQIDDITNELKELKGELDNGLEPSLNAPNKEVQDIIKESIAKYNTSALYGYFSPKSTVVIARSDCCGARTPSQAIYDIKYLSSGVEPWNFNLSKETLEKFRASEYKQYFPQGAIIGASINDYVIALSFDKDSKISTVFMSNTSNF